MAVFDVGDLVRVTASFIDAAGSTADPASVYCKYKHPSATTGSFAYSSSSELGKLATGVYYIDISITEYGTWYYRFWSGSGAGQTAGESMFQVRKQNVV